MKHKIFAKKLSDALFEISKENNLLDEVNKSVLEFDRILKINRDLKSFMQSKRYSQDEKFSILSEIFGAQVSNVVLTVLSFVSGVKAVDTIGQIRRNFFEKYKHEKNIVSVHATLSSDISEEDIIAMQKQLSQNKFLDASIKSQLKKIKLDLMKV